MDRYDVVTTLNELIETCKDGEQGFRTCAEATRNDRLKSFFEQKAQRCALAAGQLQEKVRELGDQKPERSGSTSGMVHRAWVGILATISGMDDEAILAECERGEDVAKSDYETALRRDLPPDVRSLVEAKYREVKANHDRVKEMRNALA